MDSSDIVDLTGVDSRFIRPLVEAIHVDRADESARVRFTVDLALERRADDRGQPLQAVVVDVGLGASEEYDIDARRGYFLEAVLQNADPVVVSPGATFDLTIDYRAWSRVGCPGCSYRIVVGFEGSYAGTAELGQGNYDENKIRPRLARNESCRRVFTAGRSSAL